MCTYELISARHKHRWDGSGDNISTSDEIQRVIDNFGNLKRINPEFLNIFEKQIVASAQGKGLFLAMITQT